ncbi:MAG: molecular chaperone TorD family protein [Verrucomicrobia bacterium]|nr:molecular chaperone TorD family protein [Verrucomicrobiota bacterium]
MPTPFEPARSAERGAGSENPQSVFSNFKSGIRNEHSGADRAAHTPRSEPKESEVRTLQSAIDQSLARSFLHRFLAKAYEYPNEEGWTWLAQPTVQAACWSSVKALTHHNPTPSPLPGGELETGATNEGPFLGEDGGGFGDPMRDRQTVEATGEATLRARAGDLVRQLQLRNFDPFLQDYIAIFGHAARGSCPLNEIEYGDLKADPLFQPHRLADLAAYYRAFGLEITEDATERPDHICVELEFMSMLAAKEAWFLAHSSHIPSPLRERDRVSVKVSGNSTTTETATAPPSPRPSPAGRGRTAPEVREESETCSLELDVDDSELSLCREAQKGFVREHLGRWTPAFARRLAQVAGPGVLGTLAEFTREFIEAECRRFEVVAGSEDLLLRPVDEADESLCASCGIRGLPPGAIRTTVMPQLFPGGDPFG